MDDLRDALARLDARLESLERRVAALEGLPRPAAPSDIPAPSSPKAAQTNEEQALPQAGGVFPVIGKAMLGIAGAYVLRAIAESGSFPKLAVVGLALVYTGMWLLWAVRVKGGARLPSTAYAATAALILAPMLGELSLRFGVLTASVTAIVLSAYVVTATALSWKRDSAPVIWVAVVTAVLTALALLVASHDLVPYTTALLVTAAVTEFVSRDRWLALRFLVAAAADLAMLVLIYIPSLPQSSRADYANVSRTATFALPSLLFLIYGASVAYRTVVQRRQIRLFELAQAVSAFALGCLSWLWFATDAGRVQLGGICWALAAACYIAAFIRFDRSAEERNYHVYATWSVGLTLAGSFLLLSPLPFALGLSAVSVVATVAGVRVSRLTPEFHGLVYLAAAASVSGLLGYGARALAGTFPAVPGWTVWIVSIAAVVCYLIGGRFDGDRWNHRLMRLLAAILAVSAVATFLVSVLVWLAAIGMNLGASHVAVIRTLISCALALALAYSGSRWERAELVWTAYGTLAFVAVKLLFQDLPQGRSGSIALSIFLYAAALIAVPRVARPARK